MIMVTYTHSLCVPCTLTDKEINQINALSVYVVCWNFFPDDRVPVICDFNLIICEEVVCCSVYRMSQNDVHANLPCSHLILFLSSGK